MQAYELLKPRFEHEAGTIVYKMDGHSYGLASEDTEVTGVQHITVTLDFDGGYPGFTVPLEDLKPIKTTDEGKTVMSDERQEFEMTAEDLADLMEACKPVPYIAAHCGDVPSPQGNANLAWARLGDKMGFDPTTVAPSRMGPDSERFFTAVPVPLLSEPAAPENPESTARVYYGTKRITAWPSPGNDGEYGYAVKYGTGYMSWSPEEAFEAAYMPETAMNFGHALAALNDMCLVARAGWNGKGMFLFLIPEMKYFRAPGGAQIILNETKLRNQPYVAMKTVDGTIVPWLCSVTDMLAKDWMVVREANDG